VDRRAKKTAGGRKKRPENGGNFGLKKRIGGEEKALKKGGNWND
jgi:hypothetical protein